jgi:hypothetical protein
VDSGILQIFRELGLLSLSSLQAGGPPRGERKNVQVFSAIAEIIRDLLIFAVAMSALLVVVIIVVSRMPETNPLKRLLTAVCYRVVATAAAGLIAIPIEPIPGMDAVYDLAVPVALIWYWFTLFRAAGRAKYQGTAPTGRAALKLGDCRHERPLPHRSYPGR